MLEVLFYELWECGSGCCSQDELVDRIDIIPDDFRRIWSKPRPDEDDYIFPSDIPELFFEKYCDYRTYYIVVRER